jgi:hypothetical protein
MAYYYRTNDWETLAGTNPEHIPVRGHSIPYAVFENEPEKTGDPTLLGEELARVTDKLWKA